MAKRPVSIPNFNNIFAAAFNDLNIPNVIPTPTTAVPAPLRNRSVRVSRPRPPSIQVKQLTLNVPAGSSPIPIDPTSLSHWIGLKTYKMWWFVLNRKSMYQVHHIPKKSGGVRVLHEPNAKLKYAQRMMLDRILDKFPTYDHIGAYTEDRGVKYTASRHAGHKIVIELDIKDFFGSTTRKFVREFFTAAGWPTKAAYVAADLLTYPVKKDLSIVPQGAPSSPQLCNLIGNARFDQRILAELAALDSAWVYTRYSDNLVVSHPGLRSADDVAKAINVVKSAVYSAGYQINHKKMKVMRFNHKKKPQRLLGLTVNRFPNVPAETYKRLRAQVHRAETHGLAAVDHVPAGTGVLAHLNGRVAYYLHINPSSTKLLALKRRLDVLAGKEPVSPQPGA